MNLAGPSSSQRLGVGEVVAVAVGRRAGQEDADREQVVERVRGRPEAEDEELTRDERRVELHVRDVGVDAGRVGRVLVLERGRKLVVHRRQLSRCVVVAPGLDVGVEIALAQNLGQVAGGRAAFELELDEAILRGRPAHAPPQIGARVGRHVGHAVVVAHDRHSGLRGLRGAARIEQVADALEGDEQRLLVIQVRRAGAGQQPGRADKAAVAGRDDRLGAGDPRRGRRGDGHGDEQGDERQRRPGTGGEHWRDSMPRAGRRAG